MTTSRWRNAARAATRPVVLAALAVVLAILGVSTIAYAVTRPDPNRPPLAGDALPAASGVPEPVLPAAPPSRAPAAPAAPSRATPTVPPRLPAAPVVPLGPAAPGTGPGARPRSTTAPRPKGTPSPRSTPSPKPTPSPTHRAPTLPAPLPASDPVRVRIARIGVDRKPLELGLTRAGELEVPDTAADLGWYTGRPTPGSLGAAVVAGHVSYGKPGVFYRLGTLRRGDTVEVQRKDGRTAVFTVSGTRIYPKDDFPTGDVYGFVDRAALRLITCGGTYDPKTRHFEENIVVFADMTSVKS